MTHEKGALELLWQDDFFDGWSLGPCGSGSKWSTQLLAGYRPIDGIVSKTDAGIRVVPLGVNPHSGEPAFSCTVAQNKSDVGTPGEVDHVKWLVMVNHTASSAQPGFDVARGKTLSIESVMGGRTFGTGNQPFGDHVKDPESDPRLAVVVMSTADFISGLGFDFFLTNRRIYAGYERVRFARPQLGPYAAFLYCVPVAERAQGDLHRLRISYTGESRSAKWYVDDVEVFRVDNAGVLIDRKFMLIDEGGADGAVAVGQLSCGLGMMSLLDGALNGGPALVDLSGAARAFDPAKGEPTRPMFVDPESRETSRLFGQGAELTCRRFRVFQE